MASPEQIAGNDHDPEVTMDGMPDHARTRVPRAEGTVAAWLGLIVAGGTTVTFNVWHATHSGMPEGLGVVEGIAPVALAMIISHLVATYSGGKVMRAVTFAVMVGAMVLSVGATGAVVRPAAKALWPLFGAVIDTAALGCLQVLLTLRARAARAAQARTEADAQAADERTALRAELAAAREAHAAGLGSERERASAAEAEVRTIAEAATAEAETLRAELAAAKSGSEILMRKLANATAKNTRTGAAKARRNRTANPDGETGVPNDVDARAEALAILDREPGISGARLGERVGRTARWGQMVKKELAAVAPPDPNETSEP